MSGAPGFDLAALVDVFIDLSLARRIAIIRCPALPPVDQLAFELFRRGWGWAPVACQFTSTDLEVN